MHALALIPLFTVPAAGAEAIPGWESSSRGDAWQFQHEFQPGIGNRPRAVLAIGFPGGTWSEPGQFAQLRRTIRPPEARKHELHFAWGDSFTGPTAGYHFAQILIDDEVAWEADVAGGELTPRSVRVDVTKLLAGKQEVSVALQVLDRKAVSNFAVRVWWSQLELHADDEVIRLMPEIELPPYRPLPRDLPLPSLPSPEVDWFRSAVILQPWGKTQHTALADPGDQPRRLRDDLGFNAFIVLPPHAHNAITDEAHHLTDAQFDAALKAYRDAGYKLILYSSIMHCGHAPEWQTGVIAKEHPEWSQRDAKGNPITTYGHDWLCPSTPALDYTLDYTIGLVEQYHPDAIMLDNNEFLRAEAGPTCYCADCQKRFREYVAKRFGADGARDCLAAKLDDLTIPVEPGPLFNLWIHWRNRVWAEANEAFRKRLREVDPKVAFFCNTQYLYSDWTLATDLQYEHEDMLLAESRGHTGEHMSNKMLLGRALAAGRPLWNYIGTFAEKDYTKLRPPESILSIVASTMAHLANPWIVYYGFEPGEENRPSQQMLKRLMDWRADHVELFEGLRPAAPVAALLSTVSRNCRGTPLIPPCLGQLRERGIPARAVSDRHLNPEALTDVKVLLAQGIPCMSEATADRLADWLRAGGALIAADDTGWYDEIGRLRPASALLQSLGISQVKRDTISVGAGTLILGGTDNGTAADTLRKHAWWTRADDQQLWEIAPYLSADRSAMVVHLLDHAPQSPAGGSVTIPLPLDRQVESVEILSPLSQAVPQPGAQTQRGTVVIPLVGLPTYGVVRIRFAG